MPVETHPSCPQPSDDKTKVWRFMDLAKFLDLIHNDTLHFTRLDQFPDFYEGTAFGEHLWNIRKTFDTKVIELYDAIRKRNRAQFYANSWHLSNNEPAWMWRQYSTAGVDVAICSEYWQLKSVLDSAKERLFLGLVQYEPPSRPGPIQPFDFVMSKRSNFEAEKEVRVLFWRDDVDPLTPIDELHKGLSTFVKVKIIPQNLIEEVVLAPGTPDWVVDLVGDITDRLQYGVRGTWVHRSHLYDPPLD
jgi:hypothetical protein